MCVIVFYDVGTCFILCYNTLEILHILMVGQCIGMICIECAQKELAWEPASIFIEHRFGTPAIIIIIVNSSFSVQSGVR